MTENTPDESEQRYRELIRASPAPISIFGASGDIIWGNEALVELLGCDARADFVGRSIFEFVHSDDRYTAKTELATVIASKRSTGPTTMRLVRDDGESRSIRVSTAPGRYMGRDVGQAVIVDVTELEGLREEIESERRLIENALDSLQDVFYVIDTTGQLLRWNDSLRTITGYSRSEIERMTPEEFFVPEHAARISRSIETALEEGEEMVEATVETKSGRQIPYEFRKRRLEYSDGTTALVGVGRDISDRVTRDQHLRSIDHVLRHNLRNKLNIIQGVAETGDAEKMPRIAAAADSLLSIFDNHHRIVEFLTGETTPETIDIASVVYSLVERKREEYPNSSFSVEASQPTTARAVPEIEAALEELFDNAVVHNHSSTPTVAVGVDASDSGVELWVLDNGPPIPEMEYEVFGELSAMSATYHSGGMGLWFVYVVVRESGGTIQFHEQPSGGNAICIELAEGNNHWSAE